MFKKNFDKHIPHNQPVLIGLLNGARTNIHATAPYANAGNGFPAQDLELPGGEWLEILTDIPGVEASVRGVNHGQVGSRTLLDRGLKTARR